VEKVPIKFDHDGQHYDGHFAPVSGAGSSATFHLMINNYYFGRLRMGPQGWVFDSNSGLFAKLADYFGDYVTAWYQ